MSDVAAPVTRGRLPMRLRLLIVLAVVVTGLAVFGALQAMHYSSAASKPTAMGPNLGFFRPKSDKAVPFSLPVLTAAGKAHATVMSMPQLIGKPLIVNLWSSTCTVCKQETPAIESVAKALGGRVRFVGIDTLDERGAARAFLHKYGDSYLQLFDATGVVATGYGIPGLPVTVFVTAAGKVVGENIGALTTTSLRHYLSLLFGQ